MRPLRFLAFLLNAVTIDYVAVGLHIFLDVLLGWLFFKDYESIQHALKNLQFQVGAAI